MSAELTEITVVGDDDSGIVAEFTSCLFEHDVNIEDIDQAVREGTFRMTMRVDTTGMVVTRDRLRAELDDLAEETGVDVRVRYPSRDDQSIAVLVTKESHCLEALLETWERGELGADVSVVVGNHDDLRPLAAEHGVPFHDIGDESGEPDEAELLEILDHYGVDLVALARYMRILSPKVVFRYQNRIINVHPSLLPAFPGASAYRQAVEEGARIAGVTAHYVTTELDQGPIIAQRAFDVPDDATASDLEDRGQPLEAEALVEAVQLHVDDRLTVHRGRTSLRDAEATEAQLGLPEEVADLNPDAPVDRDAASLERESSDADGVTGQASLD